MEYVWHVWLATSEVRVCVSLCACAFYDIIQHACWAGVLRMLSYVLKNANKRELRQNLPDIWERLVSILRQDNKKYPLTR